ncbi:MAG: hypothetical protein KQ78_02001 [Candidatus Izimaplasma bacterium HR2]|nr:MAG: hypothetical protein KQ78_02001 [Candidatus Izimaplasma bacterium HR2]
MKKERQFKILGEKWGVRGEYEIDNDLILKVMNDDWGVFIRVIDKALNILYESDVIIHEHEVNDEIEKIKKLYSK